MRVSAVLVSVMLVSCGDQREAGSTVSTDSAGSIAPVATDASTANTDMSRVNLPDSTPSDSMAPVTDSAPSAGARPTTWEWLAPFGAEVPVPAVPSGWKVLEFDEFRFAVPADWTVPIWSSCLTASPGDVFVSTPTQPSSSCVSAQPPPASFATIGPSIAGDQSGAATAVGTLSATQLPDPACDSCFGVYRFDNNYQVSVGGPQAEQVLATFADAGIRRVLQTGEQAATTDWQPIAYGSVAMLVPAPWPVVDLPGSVVEQTNPDGGSQMTWTSNPDACGAAMFSNGRGATAYLGTSPPPSCPDGFYFDLKPNDGLWIRSISNEEANSLGTPIARGDVDGLDVTVIRLDAGEDNRAPSSILDLLVRTGTNATWISIGVGTDPSIARTVLLSLHTP